MRGGMGNMQGMMKQMQKMQKELEQTQAQLNVTEFVGAASNDLVKITMTGDKKVTDVVIAPEVVDPEDVEMLQDLVIVAVNEAIRTLEEKSEARMSKVTGGKGLPMGF